MILSQYRKPSVGGATISKLYLGGQYLCDILEDEVREIPGMPVADWKIHGETAIPAGKYKVVLQDSGRFGLNTLTLLDVPGFKYIRVHGGNTAANTEGCLLPGTKNSDNTVASSQVALRALHALIEPEIDVGGAVWWEIAPTLMEA